MNEQPISNEDRVRLEAILVPTDFSEHADYALEHALFFAKRYKARLVVVHVMAPYFQGTDVNVMAVPSAYYSRDLIGILNDRLRDMAEKIRGEGIQTETILTMGIPFVEIVRLAKRQDIGLIVISTHGRSGLSHLIMGSTAEKVVRKAPCPVLTVRPSEKKEA
ncbi:MAG: universal stress protein [candidate division Zixibacteria bacterium]|nr:universal stress protein [candidate division Zixibacteria bacterium]